MTAACWQGKVAVVTGASRGLGAGMVSTFMAQGLRVGACAREAASLPAGPVVLGAAVDVTDARAVDDFAVAVAARFGRIDLWVNNAGLLAPIKPLRETTAEEVAALLRVNVEGVFNGTRAFVRHLRARGGEGVLVNISSGAARNAYSGWSAYCASKAAVERLTECVQLEEEQHGLRAMALAPGLVDTDMQALIRATGVQDFPQVAKFREAKARGAFNTPAHVALHLLALAFDPGHAGQGVILGVPPQVAPPA